jgi:two-component system KDP operon response regulator KdpE
MTTERVLVVDDDAQILRALRTSLRAHGYDVVTAADGQSALDTAAAGGVDVVVLDLGLPDIDGTEVIRRLRSWSEVPVIILSVRDTQEEKVGALDLGADDFVTKPFGIEELLARMRALRRRTKADDATPPLLRFGSLEVDLAREQVRLDGEPVRFTPIEYKLLAAMASNPGKLLTHRWLLQRVWGPSYGTESHYLRVFIRQLRIKLGDDPGKPRYIVTEAGLGYRWKPEPDRE